MRDELLQFDALYLTERITCCSSAAYRNVNAEAHVGSLLLIFSSDFAKVRYFGGNKASISYLSARPLVLQQAYSLYSA